MLPRISEERNLDELLEEILQINYNKPKICDLVNKGILKAQVNKVIKTFENDSEIYPQGDKIKFWNKENIRDWANSVKGTEITKDSKFLTEMIAVLKRTNIIYCKNDPRITQVLAILLFESSEEQGRLLQVSTGEGKSTICAMLASIKALQGEYVDIITSSPILAMRDAEERESFYEILGISCGSNEREEEDDHEIDIECDDTGDVEFKIKKKCYLKDIVYGDVSQFQFDWLRHKHKRLGTKGSREFGVVIVDEVDNMIIDDSSRTARLTGGLAGFEHLNPVFCGISNELNRISKRIIKIEGKSVYIDGEFKEEEGNLILEEGTNIYNIDNLHEFVAEHLTEFTTQLVYKRTIELPDFLRDFCLKSVEELVKSAIESWDVYQERVNYLTVKGEDGNLNVAPVDYESTGIVQDHETYSDGLHQFLQIKHGLKITSESVATSFISNMRYFKKYGIKIYGMTGTVGSKAEQDMLSSIYEIDFGFIPTYKAKQFKELEGIIASNNIEWHMNILDNVMQEIVRGRAVLVICETIEDVRTIHNNLLKVHSERKLRLYSRNDNDECSAIKEKVDSGDVIISTNLAGRGTDIKTSARVENNGGLHVIVTFLPSNTRVEKQAFGRTARQGAKGTAQLIINGIYAENKLNAFEILNNMYEFKQLRDCKEYIRLQETKLYGKIDVELKDELFEIYLEVDNYLREIEKNNYKEKSISEKFEEKKIYNLKLLQVEERWGIELKLFEKILTYDIETREKLKKVARNYGFKPYGINQRMFSLYKAISISLEYRASIAKNFNDQEALKSLASVLRRNIVIISSDQENPEIYKIEDANETIYIGLEVGNKKYFKNYRPLRKFSDNNKVIENYLMNIKEIKSVEYKSIINLFERKEIKQLLDEIIKQESEEINKCNIIKKEETISYFKQFFDKIKEEYQSGNKVIKNPAYMVRMGIGKPKGKDKIDILEGACNLEKMFSLPAHYNLAYAVIEENNTDYKQKAVNNLLIAKERIDEILIPHLEYMQITLSPEKKLEIKKIDLEEYFRNKNFNTEIKEFKNEGLQYLFDVEFGIDWFGVIFLGIVGTVQIGLGIYLLMNGNTTLATFLIEGGLDDLKDLVVNLLINKQEFSIGNYIKNKSFNMVVTGMIYGAELFASGLSNLTKKSVSPGSSTFLSRLKATYPKLATIMTNVAIKETIHKLLDMGADKFIIQFREEVKETILKELKVSLNDPTISIYLNKLVAIDSLYDENEVYEITINTLKILVNKQNKFEELIDKGLEAIILSKLPIEIRIRMLSLKVESVRIILSQISKMAKETAKEISEVFKDKIKESCKQKAKFETILEKTLKPKIDLEDAKMIIKLLKANGAIKEEEFNMDKALEVDFNKYNDHKLEIIGILYKYDKLKKMDELSDTIKKDLIEKFEEHITKSVLGKIKDRALGCLTNVMSDKLSGYMHDKVKSVWKDLKEKTRKLNNKQSTISIEEIKDSQTEITKKLKLDITRRIKENF
ncbi:12521_t:CDS:2 [Cetraspora pellucida]|uniref:12521_t:CDS:1 n=1 Tax=Cetraspora pellucida TaxID=1433469 RepID=A0ACA9LQ50_9GLOM|nr:12521_t:CDS:2 [Cetraspora pellucida]